MVRVKTGINPLFAVQTAEKQFYYPAAQRADRKQKSQRKEKFHLLFSPHINV